MSWYNPAWKQRLRIPITNNNSTSALSYYQHSISLTGSDYTNIVTGAKSDLSDLRVTDSDGVTLLDFELEGKDGTNSAIYLLVKLSCPASSTKNIYVYFDNPLATTVSSYTNTINSRRPLTTSSNVFTQTDRIGYNAEPCQIRLQYQDKINGGGAAHNNDLIASFDTTDSNPSSASGSIYFIRSTDSGNTWTKSPGLVVSTINGSGFLPLSLGEMSDGTILHCYSYDNNSTYLNGFEKCYVGKSNDAGYTWTNLSTTPTKPLSVPWTYGAEMGLPYGRMIFDTSGNIYQPCYGKKSGDTGWHSWLLQCLSGSNPVDGSTWNTYSTIAFDNIHTFSETAVAFMDGGNAVAVIRDDSTGDFWLTHCTDGSWGKNWASPARMNIPGTGVANDAVAPDLLVLLSKNIFLGYGIRASTTYGFGMLISTDSGVTWDDRSPALPVMFDTTYPGYDYGYTSSIQNSDGTICLLTASGAAVSNSNYDYVNVFRIIFDEDYVVNSNNIYDPCESFGSNWTHGAQFTVSSVQSHNGSNSFLLDNSAGFDDYGQLVMWSDPNRVKSWGTGKVAVSHWVYPTQIGTAGGGWGIQDSAGTFNASAGERTYISIWTTPYDLKWYNGTAYQDTATPVPLNQWSKQTQRVAIGPSSASGEILQNNISVTKSLGQYGNGGIPQKYYFAGASLQNTYSVTFYVDDIASQQFTENTPSTSAGTLEFYVNLYGVLLGNKPLTLGQPSLLRR